MQTSTDQLRSSKRRSNRTGAEVLALLAAWCILAHAGPCQGAELFSGLGGSFRPSGVPAAAAAPASAARSGASAAGLRVVLSSPSRTIASIDGQIVRVGDTVNGMRVTQIDPQGVLMVGEDGARERLEMNPLAVKQKQNPPVAARGNNKGVGP